MTYIAQSACRTRQDQTQLTAFSEMRYADLVFFVFVRNNSQGQRSCFAVLTETYVEVKG